MSTISTLDGLLQWLHINIPNFRFGTNNQWYSKSFIRSSDTWGTWQGDNGLLWWFNEEGITLYDRQGEIDTRTGRPARYELRDVFSAIPVNEPPQIDFDSVYKGLANFKRTVLRDKIIRTHEPNVVQVLHAGVQRAYWHERGLSDALINHFRLGFGTAADPYYPFPRHTIPVRLYSMPHRYTFLTRRADPQDPYSHKMPKGAPRSLWIGDFRQDIPDSEVETLYYAEGGMAVLASQELGFTPCISGTHGADYWDTAWSAFLLQTYPSLKEVIFFPDNDLVGHAQMVRIMRAFHYLLSDTSRKLEYHRLIWDEDTPQGYDPADILKHLGADARAWLEARLDYVTLEDLEPYRNHNRYMLHAGEYRAPEMVIPLEELRDPHNPRSIQAGIRYYLDVIHPHNSETVYVNASYPGSGKNFALVEIVQERAEKFLKRREQSDLERFEQSRILEDTLSQNSDMMTEEEIEATKRSIERLRKPTPKKFAVIASPFKPSFEDMKSSHPHFKEDLWFYFDSRNPENCENFDKADKAAQLGYNVSSAVCRFCPFFEKCSKQGYLSQFEKMEQSPIVSIRHQHLPVQSISKAHEVYIDEYAGDSLFTQKVIRMCSEDVRLPLGWEEWISRKHIKPIQQFLTLLRSAISEGAFSRKQNIKIETLFIGRQLFDHFNELCYTLFEMSLEDLLHSVDYNVLREASLTRIEDDGELFNKPLIEWQQWDIQRMNEITLESLPKRGIDIIFNVMREELPFYLLDAEEHPNWNSRISLFADRLEVRPMERIIFNSPVVVTDATPVRDIYEKMFPDKEVIVYAPLTQNPETHTTVLFGNGFGITEMGKNLRLSVQKDGITVINLSKNAYPNDYLKHSVEAINKLCANHASLLVISHKLPSMWLKQHFQENSQVLFNHYGNVRGLNTYTDVECVLLIGIPRISKEAVIAESAAWYYEDPVALQPDGKRLYDLTYHNHRVDEKYVDGFQFWGFEDGRIANIEFGKITGEIKQAANRVRPHTAGVPKCVYFLGSFPALDFVTDTFEYKEWLYEERQEMREWLKAWLTARYDCDEKPTYQFPGMAKVREALKEADFKIGQVALATLKKQLQQEITDAYSTCNEERRSFELLPGKSERASELR